MDSFEYAMGLVSIVVGLAISDIGTSLHKLIRHRRTLKWDSRVLLTAAFTFVVLFSMWFDLWSIHQRPEILTWPFLLSLVIELLLLFLMATTVLPDEPQADTDLTEFYRDNSRPIWTFFLLFQMCYVAHWFYFVFTSPRYTPEILLKNLPATLLIPMVACVLVMMPHRRRLHLIATCLLLSYWFFTFWASRIGA